MSNLKILSLEHVFYLRTGAAEFNGMRQSVQVIPRVITARA